MLSPSDFTVIIPVLNEEKNISPLVHELRQVQEELGAFDVIFVDDHSTDQTFETIQRLAQRFTWLKVIRLRYQSGQSVALHYGIMHAKKSLIVTLDGDGQNDPADIKKLVDVYKRLAHRNSFSLVNGCRVQRRDSGWRRFSSTVANSVRRWLLRDGTPDSGCGIKAYPKEMFLQLPSFNHMHRFLPALVHQCGGKVISVDVNHRPRNEGRSHYGTLDRLVAGIVDLCGVMWLARRAIIMGLVEEDSHEQ